MKSESFSVLTTSERTLFKKLSTPHKIQDFLDALPINFEKNGDTHYSPREVLKRNTAHCIEGALLAAAALWYHGEKPFLMDMRTKERDAEHVIALYRKNGYWGALSKTNHAVLRYRDPIYKTVRELALSYFHEYFRDHDGLKTLVSYSRPVNLSSLGTSWITDTEHLWHIDDILNNARHFPLVPKGHARLVRNATPFERQVLNHTEWHEKH
ncbi:MAG: hypothetical protein RLZZ234_685 [Candidatus Parcubacteria bacterium]|jgi:hypothetical protein